MYIVRSQSHFLFGGIVTLRSRGSQEQRYITAFFALQCRETQVKCTQCVFSFSGYLINGGRKWIPFGGLDRLQYSMKKTFPEGHVLRDGDVVFRLGGKSLGSKFSGVRFESSACYLHRQFSNFNGISQDLGAEEKHQKKKKKEKKQKRGEDR